MKLSHLERTFLRTIDSLSSLMEIRDLYTAGHQGKTADIARRIATQLGLESKEASQTHVLIHCVQKFRIA